MSEPADVTAVFGGIADDIAIIQDDDGGVWIPSLSINTLGTLQPGAGYQLFNDGEDDIVFLYPEYNPQLMKRSVLAQKQISAPEHFPFAQTGLPYTIVINSATMDGQEFADGDEIGVFGSELCVGAGVYQRGKPIVISAWKGDEKLGIPGYRAGEPLTFKAFSKRFTREFELSAEYARPEQGRFEGAAYAVVRLTGQPGLLPERYALHQNYPNPFNSRTVIPYDVRTKRR